MLARSVTRGDDGTSYGEGMTDVANTSVTCTDNSMTVTNTVYSGTHEKAKSEQSGDIEDKLQTLIKAVNSGDAGIGYNGYGTGPARARKH